MAEGPFSCSSQSRTRRGTPTTFVFPNPGALSKSSGRCLYPASNVYKDFLTIPSFAENISGQAFWLKFVSCFFTVSFICQVFLGSPTVGAGLGAGDRRRALPWPVTFSSGMRSISRCALCWCTSAVEGAKSWLRAAAQRGAWRTCRKKQGLGAGFSAKVPCEDGLAGAKASQAAVGEGQRHSGRGARPAHSHALVWLPSLHSPLARS